MLVWPYGLALRLVLVWPFGLSLRQVLVWPNGLALRLYGWSITVLDLLKIKILAVCQKFVFAHKIYHVNLQKYHYYRNIYKIYIYFNSIFIEVYSRYDAV